MNKASAAVLLACAVVTSPSWAQAQGSAGSIRMMVGFPPGGATDSLARTVAQRLSVQMSTSIYIENKPGANGNIAAESVARSAPDAQTLLFQTSSLMLARAFEEKLGFDLFTDLAPVALVARTPQVLYVHPSVPAATPAEFIAHLRANPEKIAYGSSGTGSATHLAALLFLQAIQAQALHVPYKGSPPVMLDLVAGRIQFTLQGLTSGLPLLKQNRIKALAIAGLKRGAAIPDVPTLSESAMPGFEVGAWYGIMAPGKTPQAAVRRLNSEINRALQDPAVIARFVQESADPLSGSAEEFSVYLRQEVERWGKVIKTANIKPE